METMMKTIMRMRPFFAVALMAGVLALPNVSGAGYRVTLPVTIGTSSASGSLGSSRNSADIYQSIGCTISGANATGFLANVTCTANDGSGIFTPPHVAQCISHDPTFIAIAAALRSDGYLYFSWNAGNCTQIFVESGSQFEEPNP
jgi:hypothetical protein